MLHEKSTNAPFPRLVLWLILTTMLVPIKNSKAQNYSTLVDPIVQKYLNGDPTGIAIGIIHKGNVQNFYFGSAKSEGPYPIDAQTRFEIGSISKIFTALCLSILTVENKINPDDSLVTFLGPEVLTNPEARKIQLAELATHTSGLPRLPINLEAKLWMHRKRPYERYSRKKLLYGLNRTHVIRDKQYRYSNFGAGLLGQLLADQMNTSYNQMIQNKIAIPLGLTETNVQASLVLADGHNIKGKAVPHWEFESLAGAGAIRSNLPEMMHFLEANINAGQQMRILDTALIYMQKPLVNVKNGLKTGLGWHFIPIHHFELIWHNGGTAGFSSFIGFVPEEQTGIVVLSNKADSVDPLAIEILIQLLKPNKNATQESQ